MALSELTERLAQYKKRLKKGQAQRIKPAHVDKVVRKLQNKRDSTADKLAKASKKSERKRLKHKLAQIDDLIDQARWLRDQL